MTKLAGRRAGVSIFCFGNLGQAFCFPARKATCHVEHLLEAHHLQYSRSHGGTAAGSTVDHDLLVTRAREGWVVLGIAGVCSRFDDAAWHQMCGADMAM